MLFEIKPAEGEASVEAVEIKGHKKALCICDRLKEEVEGWHNYHKLAKGAQNEKRASSYNLIAEQEFQHALVALGDLLDCLHTEASEVEKKSFNSFLEQCIKTKE